MKRVFFVIFALALVYPALAAAAEEKPLAREVRDTLERAIVNEREAAIRYDAFAAKAVEEGYPGAAALFRAQAKAERIHAERLAGVLKSHGADVPPAADTYKPNVGSTESNLRAAASAETGERDGMYRSAIESCKRYGDEATAKVFDQTRDTEVEHANLDGAAARNLEKLREPKSYFVCSRCGYTTDIRLPLCPDCQRREALEEIE